MRQVTRFHKSEEIEEYFGIEKIHILLSYINLFNQSAGTCNLIFDFLVDIFAQKMEGYQI